jgi:capsular exopolysaccharide synthesis family protein
MQDQDLHEPQVDLRDLLQVIKKRKWMIIVPLVIVLPLVMLGLALQRPTYEATAVLLIEPVNPKIVDIEEVLKPDRSREYYKTQYSLIKSRAIAEQVVDALPARPQRPPSHQPGVQKTLEVVREFLQTALQTVKEKLGVGAQALPVDAAEAARRGRIRRLQRSTKVEPISGTRLVNVTISGPDPQEVTKQVNTLADIYVRQNLENKLEASKKASAWLTREVADLRRKLRSAELALQDFMERRRFTPSDLDEKQTSALEAYADLQASYTATKTRRVDLEARVTELERVLRQPPGRRQFLATTLNNPSIEVLQRQYAELEGQYSGLSERFKPKHPKMIAIVSQMKQIRNKIESEVRKAIESVKIEYNIVLAKERALLRALNQRKAENLKLNKDIMVYATLKRDVESKRNLYDMMVRRLNETDITKGLQTNNIRIIQHATVPTQPVPSMKVVKLLISLIVVLSFGVGSAFFAESLEKRFKNPEEVEHYLRIPFLGLIPRYTTKNAGGPDTLITLRQPRSVVADCYRNVRTNIEFFSVQRQIVSLLITSAVADEGKSTTVANLGVSFAQLGKTVLLVDADLRRPTMHSIFRVANRAGLSDILMHGRAWHELIQSTEVENVKVLTSGPMPHNPAELLSGKRMQVLCQSLRNSFDIVIYDSPLVLSIPDTAIIANDMDGVLLVHNPDRSDKKLASEAKKALDRARANIIGIVFNGVKLENASYYYHYYRYDYGRSLLPSEDSSIVSDMPLSESMNSSVVNDGHMVNKKMPSKMVNFSSSNDIGIAIHNIIFEDEIIDTIVNDKLYYLIMDIEIVNDSGSSYVFHTDSALLYLKQPNKYGRAVSKVYGLAGEQRTGARDINICRYHPMTAIMENGFREEELVAAQGRRRGEIVYKVPREARDYIFVYESKDVSVTIPVVLGS